jgi:acyl-CoA thioesterase
MLKNDDGKMIDDQIRRHIENDAFVKWLGIELLSVEEGFARCAMVVDDRMLNFHGTAHGGAITTLADAAFGAACNSYGQTAVALEISINFLQAVKAGSCLVAEAREEASSNRIGLYHLTVKNEDGQIVASAQATSYRKKEWFASPDRTK